MLDQPSVDDAAAGGILEPALLVPEEKSLVDSLVDDDKRDLGPSCSIFWVQLGDRFLELLHFNAYDCVTLGVSNTIPEDDEVGRLGLPIVLIPEGLHCSLEGLNQLLIDDLLAALLDQILAVILSHSRVCRG